MEEKQAISAVGKQRGEYLAYEHSVTIDLPKNHVAEAFEKIISYCSDDVANKCTILYSSLNTGDHSSSDVKIRVLPNGVDPLLGIAAQQGSVFSKSTFVEDLQDAIVNGDKRLEMLHLYQVRLIELEKKSHSDVESLIKIAQELSQVQSDIEYAEGAKAKLLQRTHMDIVNISLQSDRHRTFWGPISDSLGDFGENLADGVSQAIVAVAYLLPWIFILLFTLYFVRIIWLKTRSRK